MTALDWRGERRGEVCFIVLAYSNAFSGHLKSVKAKTNQTWLRTNLSESRKQSSRPRLGQKRPARREETSVGQNQNEDAINKLTVLSFVPFFSSACWEGKEKEYEAEKEVCKVD